MNRRWNLLKQTMDVRNQRSNDEFGQLTRRWSFQSQVWIFLATLFFSLLLWKSSMLFRPRSAMLTNEKVPIASYQLPASVPEMIDLATPYYYSAHALNLLLHYKATQSTLGTRRGYLCSTFMKWDDHSQQILVKNILHSQHFCDWLIIIYDPVGYTEQDIYNLLWKQLRRMNNNVTSSANYSLSTTIEIVIAPPKHLSFPVFQEICNTYFNNYTSSSSLSSVSSNIPNNNQLLRKTAKNSKDFYHHYREPCSFLHYHQGEEDDNDEDSQTAVYNAALYSKMALLVFLLPSIAQYKYVWILDSDLLLPDQDAISWLSTIHQCSFTHALLPHPPLVSQPLIYEPTQFYSYLLRDNWKDSTILASSVGFVEIQCPIFDALFLEWYITGFIIPMMPALHILGVDWGFDEMFCTAAKEFVSVVGGEDYTWSQKEQQNHICSIIISNLSIHHMNHAEIGRMVGKQVKKELNLGLMKIIRRRYPTFCHNGLRYIANPFNPLTGFVQSKALKENGSIIV